MLKIKSLSKSYGKKQVFTNINCHIRPGEIVGLVGENGAGKSTLLHIIATLQRQSSGQLFLNDMNYQTNFKKIRRQIGFVPQEISLWEHLTVEENMVFFGKLSWKRKTKEQLRELCLEMNLAEWQQPVSTLSGGTKRKLNLAISLIHDPTLLLLDEPTVGIDLKSKLEIAHYLKILSHDRQVAIIYISHDMDEIINLCDYTLCLGEDPFYKTFLLEKGQNVIEAETPFDPQ